MNCTCLLPAYNESTRIENVLNILTKVPSIDEIIIIDDGSTDKTRKIVEEKFPRLKLISLSKNQGKSAAVKRGLKEVKTSHVLLFDADLSNAKVSEIDNAIKLILNQQKLDMIILKRIYESENILKNTFIKCTHIKKSIDKAACILSGERIIKTNLLKKNFKTKKIDNYSLEVAINQYFIENNKKVCWIPSSILNNSKIKELKGCKFIKKYTLMSIDITRYIGLKKYMHQLNTFCTDECQV